MTKPKAPETALANITPVQAALTAAIEAQDIPAMKEVASFAAALKAGAKQRGMGIAAENQAAEVVIRAERAIGQTLASNPNYGNAAVARAMAAAKSGSNLVSKPLQYEKPEDYGLTDQQSSQFQRLAKVPDDVFEKALATIKASGARLAKVDFYKLANQGEKVKAEARAAIREDEAQEDMSGVYEAFEQATETLIAGMDQLPVDELILVAGLIQRLAGAYTDVKASRAG